MKITSLFEQDNPILSFEIFPPKRTSPIDTLYNTLDQMDGLHPSFISVTYGAAGAKDKHSTLDIVASIKQRYNIEPLLHVTCVNSSKEDIDYVLDQAAANGIENILALRGDYVPDMVPKRDFRHASDLAAYIKQRGGFNISGACYPEAHGDSPDLLSDIKNTKIKVDAGCSHLVSQLFFDNSVFYNYLELARGQGINVPIDAGIMPITNKNQINRIVTLCGASIPTKMAKIMQRYEDHPEALFDAGIAYAVDQIVDLVAHGVDGIHLYTMNNAQVARRISESVASLFTVSNKG